jgi:hypothetical protein
MLFVADLFQPHTGIAVEFWQSQRDCIMQPSVAGLSQQARTGYAGLSSNQFYQP